MTGQKDQKERIFFLPIFCPLIVILWIAWLWRVVTCLSRFGHKRRRRRHFTNTHVIFPWGILHYEIYQLHPIQKTENSGTRIFPRLTYQHLVLAL